MKIGKRIRELRKAKGYTTKSLALRAGVAQSSVSDIENDKISPSIETLDKLLRALDLSLSDFFYADSSSIPADIVYVMQSIKKLTPEERLLLSKLLESLQKGRSQ